MDKDRRSEGSHRVYREVRYAFGTQVLTLRTRAALTESQLAEQMGVHRRTVRNWETGQSYPKAATLQRLLAVFRQQHAFTPGNERAEAHALWSQAAQDGPHTLAAFDDAWFHRALASRAASAPAVPPLTGDDEPPAIVPAAPTRPRALIDWGEAMAVPTLYGRDNELERLHEWIVDERCRVVAILGLAGMGKSSLALTLAHQVLTQFDVVLFHSLRNSPPLAEVLDQTIRAVSDQQATPPELIPAKLATLVQLLRERRCLLMLDNCEALMQPGAPAGTYRSGSADYGELLRALCEREHQSCLLLTSREKPAELGPHEGHTAPVRSLPLTGLHEPACQRILAARDITGTADQVRALARLYGGNPLALQLVANPIRELFGGDVAAFLALGDAFFSGVGQLLAQQFGRSTPLEQAILYWLAIGREPVALSVVPVLLGDAVPQREALVALESLRHRMLIEHAPDRPAFTLQPVILEFVTEQLVEAVHHELVAGPPRLLRSHALVQATAKAYVRHSQEQLIATPLLERLAGVYGDAALERQLVMLLAAWREQPRQTQGYGPGNVINLLRLQRGHLRELDLSRLAIRQAYLAEVDARDATLVDAHLTETVLAEAFHYPFSVALSGDGTLLAAGTSTGEVWLWRVADRTALWTTEGHTGGVWGVALAADGRLVASGGGDGVVRLWEASSGRPLATLQGDTAGVRSVALSADGALVVSGSFDGTARLWEANSGRLLATLQGDTGMVWDVALSSDGRLVANCGVDGTARLWETSSGRSLATLQGHDHGVRCLALSSDGQLVASGGLDGTVRLWEASSGRLLATLQGHTRSVTGVALSSDNQLVASGGEDGTVMLWEASSGQPLWTTEGHTGAVWRVALASDGRLVASCSLDGTVRLWEASSGRSLATLQGHTGDVWGVALSSANQLVASCSLDGTVRLWEASSGRSLATLQGHTGGVMGVALSSDGQLVASSGEDRTVRLWEASSGRSLATLQGHTAMVRSVALSADGRLVASSGMDGMVRLWEASSGRPLWTVQSDTGGAWGVALSSDGQLVASCGEDAIVRLWEASSGRSLATLQGHTGGVVGVALSSDGQLVASGGLDGTVRLWEASSGRSLATLQGHTGGVMGVALSSDGQLVASGSQDGTVRLWEASSGRLLTTLQGHTAPVWHVALSADNQLVASGSLDGTVRLWEVQHSANSASLRTLRAERRYERMDISGLTGITQAQHASLIALGAVERSLNSTVALASPPSSEPDQPLRRDQQG